MPRPLASQVTHTPSGATMIKNFVLKVVGCGGRPGQQKKHNGSGFSIATLFGSMEVNDHSLFVFLKGRGSIFDIKRLQLLGLWFWWWCKPKGTRRQNTLVSFRGKGEWNMHDFCQKQIAPRLWQIDHPITNLKPWVRFVSKICVLVTIKHHFLGII